MKQLRNTITSILLAASMILTAVCPSLTAQAADAAFDDESRTSYSITSASNDYYPWSTTVKSYLVPLEDGGRLMSINYGSSGTNKALLVGYYNYTDTGYEYDDSSAVTIGLEYPLFGGFYATDNYYFILTAQYNREENKDKPVFRITRFNTDWTNPVSAELNNCNSARPFAFGSARMEACGNYLMIRTCREMFKAYDGRNHQASLTIQLDMNTMAIKSFSTGYSGTGYVSHSFNQFVKAEGNYIITIDHGDAYPRGVIFNKIYVNPSNGSISGSASANLLSFKGSRGNYYTNASVGGLEISSSSYLIAGSSIDQDPASNSSVRNIFISAVDKSTNTATLRWLTTDTEGDSYKTPHLVKISNDEFLVLWQKYNNNNTIYCARINGKGELIAETGTPDNSGTETENPGNDQAESDAPAAGDTEDNTTETNPGLQSDSIAVLTGGNLYDCPPVVVSGSSLMWSSASTSNSTTDLTLYKLNLETLKESSAVSPGALEIINTANNITFPVSTVETVDDSTYDDVKAPGNAADSEPGSSGSTGSTGGSSGSAGIVNSTNLPFIQDASGRQGWDAIIAEAQRIAAAPEGGTVSVNMNGTYQVPGRVLESISGKNTTLILNIGQGICWKINGNDITTDSLKDIYLYVKANTQNIPKSIADSAADGLEYMTMNLTQNGEFGFPLTMSVRFVNTNGVLTTGNGSSDKYIGMYANLFYYNTDLRSLQSVTAGSFGGLEFICSGKIGEDGTADLTFTHGADYLIILSPQPMGDTQTPDDTDNTVTQPEEPDETAPAEVKSVKLSKTVYIYSGKARKPSVVATDTNGSKISSSNYTVSYKNNKNVGRATVTVKFKNGYSGTVQKTFTIRPAGTSIQKTASLSKGFTVKWKKNTAQTSGYQLQYFTAAGLKSGNTSKVLVKNTSSATKTIKNLKAAKTYYVRIRTYKTVQINGKSTKLYSAWSAAKKIKTK